MLLNHKAIAVVAVALTIFFGRIESRHLKKAKKTKLPKGDGPSKSSTKSKRQKYKSVIPVTSAPSEAPTSLSPTEAANIIVTSSSPTTTTISTTETPTEEMTSRWLDG